MHHSSSKVVLITGASSGIGKAAALTLLKHGHVVYGAARRVQPMQELADAGGHVVSMDVTDHERVGQVVEQIIQEQGRIDVLFNNAGFGLYGAVEDTPIDQARRQFEVNLFGLAAVTQAVLPHMRAQGTGLILNTSSMGGKIYTPMGAWYHATKHALEGWSDCLRLELEPLGIHVAILEPGVIDTGFGDVVGPALLERSGQGPYAELAMAVAKATAATYSEGASSSPQVISRVVLKAVESARPKTRYVAGKYARPLMFARHWISDRAFDKVVMSQVRSMM